jgi:hypothetical protein
MGRGVEELRSGGVAEQQGMVESYRRENDVTGHSCALPMIHSSTRSSTRSSTHLLIAPSTHPPFRLP